MKSSKVEIRWHRRYSLTMEDDDNGRWERVALAGRFTKTALFRGKISYWEIARIKKLVVNNNLRFTINFLYPSNGRILNDTLEEAEKEVELTFRWFINCITHKL